MFPLNVPQVGSPCAGW